MHVSTSRWRFRPRLIPTLATAALLPVLLGLGSWQLERAGLKRELIARMQARAGDAPVEIAAASRAGGALVARLATGDTENWQFQRVRVHGRYVAERQFLLDNRTRGGRAGFEVLTPLVLDSGGGTLLINRGWVPLDGRRDRLPDVSVSAGKRVVTGALVAPPSPGLKLGPGGFEGETWPRVVQWVDAPAMSAAFGDDEHTWLPALLQLAPGEADGFARTAAVRTFAVPPERHHGYAVQWFALAATLLALYLGLNLQRRGATHRGNNDD